MKNILVIDLGTACDNRLMEYAISKLVTKYKIVYLTDEKHILPDNYIKIPYKTPDFFINDPKLKIANTSKNFLKWILTNPKKSIESYQWSNTMTELIKEILLKYNITSIHILYPSMRCVWLIEKNNIPIYVYYYAPGLLSYNIPWLFNSIVKKKNYNLYDEANKSYNMKSGIKMLKRSSLFGKRHESIYEVLKSVNHIICWEESILPKLDLVYKDLNVYYAGALLNSNIKSNIWPINEKINNFIKSKKQIIFISFGSYGNSPLLNRVIPKLLEVLQKSNYGIIYHNGNIPDNENLISISGFIQYEWIVPKTSLIIFTGSVCLQNICLYNSKPMLFVPLLAEQFYWAKNYEYYTNIPYINYLDSKMPDNFNLKKTMHINKYLRTSSKNIINNNTTNNIYKIVK
jgi:hypothetical protein